MALLPHIALSDQIVLKPCEVLEPHMALLPHIALLPEVEPAANKNCELPQTAELLQVDDVFHTAVGLVVRNTWPELES